MSESHLPSCEITQPSPPMQFIAAIKTCIDFLALQVEFRDHEAKACAIFADIFGPVPHLTKLPITETVARIPLKDDHLLPQWKKYSILKHWEKAMEDIITL